MPEFKRDTLRTFLDVWRAHGDFVCMRGLWTSFMLIDAQHVEYVLQTNSRNYRKGKNFREIKAATGNGLFVSEGDVWLRQRRLAQPAFHRQRIASFARIMTDSTEAMLEQWRPLVERGETVKVDAEMLRLTLGIVGKALFSRDLSDEADTLSQSFEIIRRHTVNRVMSVVKSPASFPTPQNRRFRKAVSSADRVVFDLIAERRRRQGNPDDLLSLLMAARDEETGEGLSDQELLDQAKTLIGAGYETTTQALAWTWYLLARHPDVEQKLRVEISEVLGGQTPAAEDLPRLKYTLMVFQEAMRLYPPAWAISRSAIEADEIGGYRVPAGSEILLLPYITHRHPKYWEKPEEFYPEHFLPEKVAARPAFAYFPFSGGPRRCIGNSFALMEAQLIIAMVAQKYRLRLADEREIEPETSLTLRPRGGVRMRLCRA
ncbi:MAG TPA: cytochrome P450 [Pyrinomonadaceae bacterium]